MLGDIPICMYWSWWTFSGFFVGEAREFTNILAFLNGNFFWSLLEVFLDCFFRVGNLPLPLSNLNGFLASFHGCLDAFVELRCFSFFL